MLPFRLLVSLLSTTVIVTCLIYVSVAHDQSHFAESDAPSENPLFSSFFSFHGPSALFTPTALISLTDDNYTVFAAKPAAFGPLLPSHGLSGPIWIGSGFAEDVAQRTSIGSTVEGELGCNDVPGWHDPDAAARTFERSLSAADFDDELHPYEMLENYSTDEIAEDDSSASESILKGLSKEANRSGSSVTISRKLDLHLIQERAEMTGKVVLLSRGGCSFLEKVNWAQRRGAMGVIIGDSVRGGPLVQMYARGDTSNVTIPAVFTSHGTAHLLSTLMPPARRESFFGHPPNSTYSELNSTLSIPSASTSAKPAWIRRMINKITSGRHKQHFANESQPAVSAVPVHGAVPVLSRPHPHQAPKLGSIKDDSVRVDGSHDSNTASYLMPPVDLPLPVSPPRERPVSSRPGSGSDLHDGLWVTLSPSSMSTSPFFNTLFMLVVSPLVTLAVVYAMLLLRTRIQRRRWRAPKSVVDRLPIRIYRRITSHVSPTEESQAECQPLLSSAVPTDIPPRPRSPGQEASGSTPNYGTLEPTSVGSAEQEKQSGMSEWRRLHGSNQVECVICLEEYEDGVSRVLQLPCGHDFHADCITPWLTTRRRTCPICKGDVVRSMQGQRNGSDSSISSAASSASLGRSAHAAGAAAAAADADDIQVQAAETANHDSGADLPVPVENADEHDLESASVRPARDASSSRDRGFLGSVQRRFAAWRSGGRSRT